jgi:hypothetical protein
MEQPTKREKKLEKAICQAIQEIRNSGAGDARPTFDEVEEVEQILVKAVGKKIADKIKAEYPSG